MCSTHSLFPSNLVHLIFHKKLCTRLAIFHKELCTRKLLTSFRINLLCVRRDACISIRLRYISVGFASHPNNILVFSFFVINKNKKSVLSKMFLFKFYFFCWNKIIIFFILIFYGILATGIFWPLYKSLRSVLNIFILSPKNSSM